MLRIAAVTAAFAGLSHQAATPRAVDNSNLAPLKFNSNGTFQIAVFSDLHFGQSESSTGPEQDNATVRVIGDVLDYDPPDLVVLNGDLINGDTTFKENSTDYLDMIVAPIIERNLTWASTYGNHDHNYNSSGANIYEREQSFSGARTQKMVDSDDAGITNYYLPVYSSNCTTTSSCTPEMILWFFDSRGGYYYQGDAQPNWVDTSVVTWFNETNTELVDKYNKTIPSLAFVHIPINATWTITNSINGNYQPGVNEDPAVPQQGADWCADADPTKTCTYGEQDVPFMEALVSIPGIIGLFYGHDHGNTWCYKWDSKLDGMDITGNGINLCYGQHGGYGGYGDWIRGAREIVVTLDGLKEYAVDTHIRTEKGDKIGSVALNATYNDDYYPESPNDMTYLSELDSSTNAALNSGASSHYTPPASWLPAAVAIFTFGYLAL